MIVHGNPASHPRPEFHLKTPGQENDVEQKKAPCSARAPASLPSSMGVEPCSSGLTGVGVGPAISGGQTRPWGVVGVPVSRKPKGSPSGSEPLGRQASGLWAQPRPPATPPLPLRAQHLPAQRPAYTQLRRLRFRKRSRCGSHWLLCLSTVGLGSSPCSAWPSITACHQDSATPD